MRTDLPKAVLGLYGIADRGRFPSPRWTHDHGLALIVDGKVEWVVELERITGIKHDNRLAHTIERLVHDAVVRLPDEFIIASVDSLVGRCFVSSHGRWRIEADHVTLGGSGVQTARAAIGTREYPAFVVAHEAAHLGSALAFYPDWDEETLLVHVDGGASQCNASAWEWTGEALRHVHNDWETLWAVLNFGHNDLTHALLGLDRDRRMAAPGRLMGLASFAPTRADVLGWLKENEWFREHWQSPPAFFKAASEAWGWTGDLTDTRDPFIQSIASAVQGHFESVLTDWIGQQLERRDYRRVVFSGGAALNIGHNSSLKHRLSGRTLEIPPCCNDSGLALGAAALVWRMFFGPLKNRSSPFLQSQGLGSAPDGGSELDVAHVADRLASGDVIGWYQGAGEVGPRALGHRSLLCSPASLEMKRRISEEVKHREWFRPVAPVVLEELADEVFPGASSSPLSTFMLESFPVDARWQNRVPAVCHVDGTARVQVARPMEELASLRMLLAACWEKHRLPCLVNTSFNGPGEPIVHRREDALDRARRLGIDGVVIGERFHNTAG